MNANGPRWRAALGSCARSVALADRGFIDPGPRAAGRLTPRVVSRRGLWRETLRQRIWRVAWCIALTPTRRPLGIRHNEPALAERAARRLAWWQAGRAGGAMVAPPTRCICVHLRSFAAKFSCLLAVVRMARTVARRGRDGCGQAWLEPGDGQGCAWVRLDIANARNDPMHPEEWGVGVGPIGAVGTNPHPRRFASRPWSALRGPSPPSAGEVKRVGRYRPSPLPGLGPICGPCPQGGG